MNQTRRVSDIKFKSDRKKKRADNPAKDIDAPVKRGLRGVPYQRYTLAAPEGKSGEGK